MKSVLKGFVSCIFTGFFILLQKQLEIEMIFSRFFDVFGMFHDLLMSAWLNASVLCVRSTFGAPRSCAEPQPFDSSDFHQFFHPFALLFSCFFHFIIFYHILSYFIIFCNFYKYMIIMIHFHCFSVSSFVSFSSFRATCRFIQFCHLARPGSWT